MGIPMWLQAGLWGWVGGSALVLGAAIGYFVRVPRHLIAAVMAFGAGVLISALSFDLMDVAYNEGGLGAVASGFLGGATVFTAADWWLARRGAKRRKRSGQQPSEAKASGSGAAIAAGALLDGIPESVVIGVSLLSGVGVSAVFVAAVFLSNVPEALSSAAGMSRAGRSAAYIFGVWGGIALLSGLASLFGYVAFGQVGPGVVAATTAFAAGAILAMLADTMVPEAFERTQAFTGLITVLGFLAAFALSKLEAGG